MKTEPAVEETISQSIPQLQNTDVDLYIKMNLLQPHHPQSTNNPKNQGLHEHQQELEKSTDLENLYPSTCLKKEGGCGVLR